MSTHRCGYVGIVGRPNVGKSTFLNHVLQTKVSITSQKAQTTRNRVVGIYNTDALQMVLVDTPGHHEAWSRINKAMVREVEAALSEVDVVLLLVDLVPAVAQAKKDRPITSRGEEVLLQRIARGGCPVVLGLNKVDLVEPQWALPVIQHWQELHEFAAVVPFSALQGLGADTIIEECAKLLPEHPAFFPKDQISDNSERFVVEEVIREKLFHLLDKELPYSVAVQVLRLEEEEAAKPDGPSLLRIYAQILVERKSQKGIVIGKGGQMLKRVGTAARKELQKLLGCRIRLDLHVKVEKDWTSNPRKLRELGLDKSDK